MYNMKRIINIILLVLLSTPVFSQGFNDSIMNKVLFDEIVSLNMKRDSTIKVYYSYVGAELYSKPSVDYMLVNGVKHRPGHTSIELLPTNHSDLILNELNIPSNVLTENEVLAKITIGKTTYQEVAKMAINAWLNSPGHRGCISRLGMYNATEIISISSYYNSNDRSVYISLNNFVYFE